MKKLFGLLCFSFLLIQTIKGQIIDTTINLTPKELRGSYIQKRKTNNTVGWVMLVSGIGMTAGGIYIHLKEGFEDNFQTKGLWLFYLGTATTLASIPFFISAGSNKRKARLVLKTESVTFGNKIFINSNYAALALRIPLSGNKDPSIK